MTYSELYAAIQSWTENTFPATSLADGSLVSPKTQIDTFIKTAEQKIYNSVQIANLRKNVTGLITTGNKYLATPADFLSAYSMSLEDAQGNYHFLLNKDVNFIREAYPSATATGTPRYYALFGPRSDLETELTFMVGPTPDASYNVELHYFYMPESIVTAGTSWLGDNFDSVLLYGCLVEACIFMKGEADMMAAYEAKYKEALALLKNLGDGKQRGDAYRDGQVRTPVR